MHFEKCMGTSNNLNSYKNLYFLAKRADSTHIVLLEGSLSYCKEADK